MSDVLSGIGSALGIGDSDNNFRATAPVNTFNASTDQFGNAITGAQNAALAGANANAGIQGQEGALAQMLTAQANGGGPNPALEQLKQTTAQNISGAAGQVASQRGINPALAARLALDAGANANQTAAGQAATMRAQQTLGAQQQLQSVLGQQAGQNIAGQQANTQLLGTAGGLQKQGEQINAGVASGNQAANIAAQQINAGASAQNAQTHGNTLNSIMGAAAMIAEGGEVPTEVALARAVMEKHFGKPVQKKAMGDMVLQEPQLAMPAPAIPSLSPGQLAAPREFGSGSNPMPPMQFSSPTLGINSPESASSMMRGAAGAAGAPGPASSIGQFLKGMSKAPKQDTMGAYDKFANMHLYGQNHAKGGATFAADGKVPGKAPYGGDTERNDIVPAKLTPGEFVVKKTIAQRPGVKEALQRINEDPGAADDFVAHLLKKTGKGKGYSRVAEADKRVRAAEGRA